MFKRAESGHLVRLKVVGKTSWGLSDVIALRGPASVDEEGDPVGPDEVEVKITSPTRMGLTGWFKDGAVFDMAFTELDAGGINNLTGLAFLGMEVVERTSWGLSTTCRLRTKVLIGERIETKVSVPWADEKGRLAEGLVYNIVFDPVEEDEFAEPPEPDEDQERPDHGTALTLRDLMDEVARLSDAIGDWEDDEAPDPPTDDGNGHRVLTPLSEALLGGYTMLHTSKEVSRADDE